MSTQEQKTKQSQKKPEENHETVEAKDLSNEELGQDVEDLLDEIDGVLEEDAETFVKQFLQKGGQ